MVSGNIESEADYTLMANSVNQIHEDSITYKNISDQLLIDIDKLKNCWEGEDQTKFLAKITECCDKLQKMSQQLENNSQILENIKKTFIEQQQGLADETAHLPV